MKFSDMMGPDDESTEQDAAVTTDAGAPPLPPLVRSAPPLPETPVRFGGNRSALDEAVAGLTPVSEPPAAAAPPRAFGSPAGVPALPLAPPLPEIKEPEAVVEAPDAETIIEAPEAETIIEAPEAETVVDEPEAIITAPTGGTVAAEPAIEPPTGGTIAAEVAAAEAPVEEPAPPAPIELSRPAAASAFATIATTAAPEAPALDEPVVDAVAGADDDLPTLHDVMAELAPSAQTFDELTASPEQLDTTSWLEGLGSIDDDLLPR